MHTRYVWLVLSGICPEFDVDAVFSSRLKAKAYMEHRKSGGLGGGVEIFAKPYTVDLKER